MLVGKGSMLGEEDCISNNTYSCSVKCYSLKGSAFAVKKDDFLTLRRSDDSWLNVLEKAFWKEKGK
jgi:CRP-like cAMP-binding protein